jgi:hypothetical protein
MRLMIGLGLVTMGLAQQAPSGILRGDLVAWKSDAGSGHLSLKTLEGNVYECAFDTKTYFERDNQRIAPPAMVAGDRLEIVSDRKSGAQNCYARTVHVMDPFQARLGPGARLRLRRGASPTEAFAPRGDLTYAGVVVRVDPDILILKTRNDGEKMIVLRHDTRYIGNGQRVDPKDLQHNTRVFVRAGRNFENEIEAYQVVWGRMVRPD